MKPSELGHGIHLSIPEEVYHVAEPHVASNGGLKVLAKSPAHYMAWIACAGREETDALRLGRAVHCAMLEPARFAATYVVMPYLGDVKEGVRTGYRSNAAKARRAEWEAEHGGAPALGEDEVTVVRGMVESVLAHPKARLLLEGGQSEVTCRWRDPASGVEGKSRPDHHSPDIAVCADLKSTQDASESAFARAVGNFGYHLQCDWYVRGLAATADPATDFIFVAAEKEPPYAVALYQIDQDALAMAYETNSRRLDRLAKCLASNEWPGLPLGIATITLPPWIRE